MSSLPSCSICGDEVDINVSKMVYCRACHHEFHLVCLENSTQCPKCGTSFFHEADVMEDHMKNQEDSLKSRQDGRLGKILLFSYMAISTLIILIGIGNSSLTLIVVGSFMLLIPIMIYLAYLLLEQRMIYLLKRSI